MVRHIGLAVLCFYSKQVFGPRTCQISTDLDKFCIHLLLYGIHFWADLDRDRRAGGSRKKPLFSVIVVTHPKSYIETTDRRDFGGKSGGEDWCYREKFRNFVAWAEPDPKYSIFRVLGYHRLSCAQPTGNSFTPSQ